MHLQMSLSLSRLRFLSKPTFILSFSSSHSSMAMLHSHSLPTLLHNADDSVSLFNQMLYMHPTPPIVEFSKILGSLVKMKHYRTAVSLSQRLEFRGIEPPNIVTLSILINCFCHLGQMNFAFSVLGKILKRDY